MTNPNTRLSPDGQARRDQILQLARRSAAEKRRRRLGIRAAVAATIALAVFTFLYPQKLAKQTPSLVRHVTPASKPAPPHRNLPREIVVQRIQTDPTLVDRLSVHPQTRDIVRLNENQLVSALAESGNPAGIVQINGRTAVVFQNARNH